MRRDRHRSIFNKSKFINMAKTSLKQSRILLLFQVIIVITLIFNTTQLINAQSHAEIKNVDFMVRNDSMFVTYDLTKAEKQESFNITLKITTASGKIITPYTLNGDVGEKILGGRGKRIVWIINKDNIVINEEIAVEVLATPMEMNSPLKFVSRGKALLLSAFVPGLGLTKLKNGGPYWIMAFVVYGSVAGSYIYYSSADKNYSKYLNSMTESERNSLHSTVQSRKTISNLLIYGASAVWLGNIIWTLASKNNTKSGEKGISFSGIYDPLARAPLLTLKYKF